MTRKQGFMLVGIIFIIMFVMAMNDNVRGIIVPTLKSEFNVTDKSIGLMLFVSYFAYMMFTYIGGILSKYLDHKMLLISGLLLNIAGVMTIYIASNFNIFLLGLFISNSGIGIMTLVVNTIVPRINIGFQAILMNMIHFCFGMGATFTHRVSGYLISTGFGWRNIYMIIGLSYIFVLVCSIFLKFPQGKAHRISLSSTGNGSKKLVVFYMIALGMYVSAEVHTSSWFVNYLNNVYRLDENSASKYTALFFLVFAIGRLLGGFVAERFGYVRTVRTSIVLACITYFVGLIIGESGMIIVSISGLFFSIVFPTLVLSINDVFENPVSITSLVLTAATATSMVMGLVIGNMNDIIGVYKTYYIIPFCLMISSIFVGLIYKEVRQGKLNNSL